METLFTNPRFSAAYARLNRVSLNPARHSAPNARVHSDDVARRAAQLAEANACSATEVELLTNLGYAHDIGKITGSARPVHSLEVLAQCEVRDVALLSLVKWHDINLPWYLAMKRGEPPSDKAWRRLAKEVDHRLLCIFMVADRVDAPGGWRQNAPLGWFLAESQKRSLVGELVLDVQDLEGEASRD